MCEFVSWIEDDGNVLFLTATDLKTPRGLKIWKQIKDDIIGHGAIREYYSKDGIPMEGGVNQECTNFSKPKNFPIEIQKALVDGAFIGMAQIPERLLSGTLHKKYNSDRARLGKKYRADKDILDEKYDADIDPFDKKYTADTDALGEKYRADRYVLHEKYRADLDKKYNAVMDTLVKKYTADTDALSKRYNADTDALDKKYSTDREVLHNKYWAGIFTLSDKYWLLLKDPKNRSKAWRKV